MNKLSLGLLLLVVGACASKSAAPARAADAPVGTVIAASGEVSYASAADRARKPVVVGLVVRRDMTFKTGPGASLDVRFDNNYVWKLAENRERAVASLAIVDRAPAPEMVEAPDEADPGDRTSAAGRHTEQTAAATAADQAARPAEPTVPEPVEANPGDDGKGNAPKGPGRDTTKSVPKEPKSDAEPPKGGGGCDEVECLIDPSKACCAKKGGGGSSKPHGDRESVLPERPSTADIKQGIAVVKPRILACPHAGFTGAVKAKIVIANEGSVSSVVVTGEGIPEPLAACVTKELKRARFSKSQRGVTVNYPFLFR